MEDQARIMKTVFTVVERGQGKSIWVRIGVGFVNKDGSLNLHLDAMPTNGKLQVRDWEPFDRRADNPGGPGPYPAPGDTPPPPRPRPRPQPSGASEPLI
jgi:hypothetical protein